MKHTRVHLTQREVNWINSRSEFFLRSFETTELWHVIEIMEL